MKSKLVLFVVSICLACGVSFAYTPSANELKQVVLLRQTLNELTSGNLQDKRTYYTQIKSLQRQFSRDPRLNYILEEISITLQDPILAAKAKAKQEALPFKQAFLSGYLTGLKALAERENCTGRYSTLDTISFLRNFPTALTLATRYREASCGYYLPANGDGPFQIVSKDYGTGAINEDIFIQSVEDFISFSKAKRTQYKSKLGISLTYTGRDMTGLVSHSALYNGGYISGNVALPYAPKYVWDGYGDAYSGATKYGIVPKFLKVLEWEVNN